MDNGTWIRSFQQNNQVSKDQEDSIDSDSSDIVITMVKKIFWLSLMFSMLGFVIKKCIPYTYHGYKETTQSQSLLILDGFICVELNENSNNKYSYKKSCES